MSRAALVALLILGLLCAGGGVALTVFASGTNADRDTGGSALLVPGILLCLAALALWVLPGVAFVRAVRRRIADVHRS